MTEKTPVLLVVDDRPDNLFVIEQLMGEYLPACKVLTALNAETALRLAVEQHPDGILSDIQMPGTNGIELCRRLKQNPETSSIPIVLMTAHKSEPKVRIAALEAGADDFIAKPIDNVELATRLKVMFRIKRAHDNLELAKRELEKKVEERTCELQATIRQQEQTEHELLKSEALLSAFTEALPDISFIYNEDGTYVRVFATQKDLLIVETDDLIGKKVHDVIPDQLADDFLRVIQDTIKTGESQIFEYNLNVQAGEKWFEARTSPMKTKIEGKSTIVWIVHDITYRKLVEDQIKASLKEKEILLHEIHHRVKNNMQVINSLLKMQANNIEDNQVKEILKESQNRVYAMSAVHETLHGSEKLSEINLKTYLSKITTSIFQTYFTDHRKVNLNSKIDDLPISINQAYPLGLITNELISNSLKYAFPDEREGEISVSVNKLNQGLELTVMDDGVGIPNAFDWNKSNTLGLKLVRTLVENQLDGSIELDNQNGTKITIKFNIET
ncbi:MAG: response regulator [Deltaproteobacteria bacterium]|nr:response regulator [Deltaproteobacteria bacterium]